MSERTEHERTANARRRLHGRTVAHGGPKRAGYVQPAQLAGLELSDCNGSLIVVSDSRILTHDPADREFGPAGQWTVTAPVRRYFKRSAALVFEIIHADECGAVLRVSGPVAVLAGQFEHSYHWPGWARMVRTDSTERVCGLRMPSERMPVDADGRFSAGRFHQSEVKRDRDARAPSRASRAVKRAVQYVRASAITRQRLDSTGPRGLLG